MNKRFVSTGCAKVDRSSTVYITKEEKENLINYIDEIKKITDRYPFSNDYSDHFVTTMSRVKGFVGELNTWIELLDIKDI